MPTIKEILQDPLIACTQEEIREFEQIASTMRVDLDALLNNLSPNDQQGACQHFKRNVPRVLKAKTKPADGFPAYTFVSGVCQNINCAYLDNNPGLTANAVFIRSDDRKDSQDAVLQDKQTLQRVINVEKLLQTMMLILALVRKHNIVHVFSSVPDNITSLMEGVAICLYASYVKLIITDPQNLPYALDRTTPYNKLFAHIPGVLCHLPTVTTFIWADALSDSQSVCTFKEFAEYNSMLSSSHDVSHYADAKREYQLFYALAQARLSAPDLLEREKAEREEVKHWIKAWPEEMRISATPRRARLSNSQMP